MDARDSAPVAHHHRNGRLLLPRRSQNRENESVVATTLEHMSERTCEQEADGSPAEPSLFRWDLACLGALLGAVTCGVGYWPAMASLRDVFEVSAFPPGGATYWLCWWLPVAVVVGAVGPLLLPRSSRSFASGLVVGFGAVAGAMCVVGYSVDGMPLYM